VSSDAGGPTADLNGVPHDGTNGAGGAVGANGAARGGAPDGALSPAGPVGDASSLHALRAVHEELARLEEALCGGRRPVSGAATKLAHTAARGGAASGAVARGAAGHVHVPAWLRPTAGENRWAVAATILVAIGLQVALPDRLTLLNRWLLPGLELALLIALVVATPVRFNRESRILRAASLTLSGLLTLANSWSAVLLVLGLVNGAEGQDAGPLLSTGAAIWSIARPSGAAQERHCRP